MEMTPVNLAGLSSSYLELYAECFASHLEGSEPHEPVQAVVVRRYETRLSVKVSWLTRELVFLPNRLWGLGILTQSALENHLRALLGDAGKEWKWNDGTKVWIGKQDRRSEDENTLLLQVLKA